MSDEEDTIKKCDAQQMVQIAELAGDVKYIRKKVDTFCTFKDEAMVDLANLKTNSENTKNLPARVSSLELWRAGQAAAFALACLVVGWWLTYRAA